MDMYRITLKDILMGYLCWISSGYLGILVSWDILVGYIFCGDVATRYPEYIKISIDNLEYLYHLPRYPKISNGENSQMTPTASTKEAVRTGVGRKEGVRIFSPGGGIRLLPR